MCGHRISSRAGQTDWDQIVEGAGCQNLEAGLARRQWENVQVFFFMQCCDSQVLWSKTIFWRYAFGRRSEVLWLTLSSATLGQKWRGWSKRNCWQLTGGTGEPSFLVTPASAARVLSAQNTSGHKEQCPGTWWLRVRQPRSRCCILFLEVSWERETGRVLMNWLTPQRTERAGVASGPSQKTK